MPRSVLGWRTNPSSSRPNRAWRNPLKNERCSSGAGWLSWMVIQRILLCVCVCLYLYIYILIIYSDWNECGLDFYIYYGTSVPDGDSGHCNCDLSPSSEVDNTVRILVEINRPSPAPTFLATICRMCAVWWPRPFRSHSNLSVVHYPLGVTGSERRVRVTLENACEYGIGVCVWVWGGGWWVMIPHLDNHRCVAFPSS